MCQPFWNQDKRRHRSLSSGNSWTNGIWKFYAAKEKEPCWWRRQRRWRSREIEAEVKQKRMTGHSLGSMVLASSDWNPCSWPLHSVNNKPCKLLCCLSDAPIPMFYNSSFPVSCYSNLLNRDYWVNDCFLGSWTVERCCCELTQHDLIFWTTYSISLISWSFREWASLFWLLD